MLRKWAHEQRKDPAQAFPGPGRMKLEHFEMERLCKKVARRGAVRGILEKSAATFARDVT